MRNLIDDIEDFHNKFFPDMAPKGLFAVSDDVIKMRLNFMLEELNETAKALGYNLDQDEGGKSRFYRDLKVGKEPQPVNRHEVLDGLIDLLYVLMGTAHLFGLLKLHGLGRVFTKFEEAWYRVHMANMRKIRVARPAESKRGVGFDVKKPEGWQAPDLSDLVED